MSSREKHTTFFLLAILALGVFLRFWKLNDIPAEMWGDVTEGYKFASRVLNRDFYWRFIFGGDGPFFSYLVALISVPLGLSFLTMKIATTVVGVLLVLATYVFGKTVMNEKVGLAAAFLMAVSKWAVIYGRMAKPHIAAALFSAISLWTLYQAIHKKKSMWWIISGSSLGLGMYTQSAFWGVPVAIVALIAFLARRLTKHALWGVFIFLAMSIPLVGSFFSNPNAYTNPFSFFGEKLIPKDRSFSWTIGRIGENLFKNLLMFHIKGDVVFRNNPPRAPHLDILTGLVFLVGVVTLPLKLRPWFWIPFFAFQIPSVLDLNFFGETANAGRTIALLPIVFLAAGCGTWTIYRFLRRMARRPIVILVGVTTMAMIVILNWRQVFNDYPKSLPNHNVPFGRIIAETINQLPVGTDAILIGCCWGDWGQPEPDGIRFRLTTPRTFTYIPSETFSCQSFNGFRHSELIIVDPREEKGLLSRVALCLSELRPAITPFIHPTEGTIFVSYLMNPK